MARASRRAARDDDHGAAVSGRLAAARRRFSGRAVARGRPLRSALRPRIPRLSTRRCDEQGHRTERPVVLGLLVAIMLVGGPESPALQARETIVAIQIHGNTLTPDDE